MFHGHFTRSYQHDGGRFHIPELADAIVDISFDRIPVSIDRYIIEMGYARMMVENAFQWTLPHAIIRYLDDQRAWGRGLYIWDIPKCTITVTYAYITGFAGLKLSYTHDAVLVGAGNYYEWRLGDLTHGNNPAIELSTRVVGNRMISCLMDQGRVASVSHYQIFANHHKQKI